MVYLVRSPRTYARIRSLTTGTFNLVVKDRIAIRLSGANSVQAETHECESDCPRNPTNILCRVKPCQPEHPTGFPDVFHIGNSPFGSGAGELPAIPQKQVPHDKTVRSDKLFRLGSGLALALVSEQTARNSMVLRLGGSDGNAPEFGGFSCTHGRKTQI